MDSFLFKTRMHSSRMRTARSSSRLRGAGGVCPSACLDTPPTLRPPRVWAWRPPGCGPGDSPGCGPGDPPPCPDPPSSPLGVGLETSKACWDTTPLETCKACWDTTCQACWDTTPPPVNKITDMCENITLLKLRCGR